MITYNENDTIHVVSNFKSFTYEVKDVPYQPIDKIIVKFVNLSKMEKLVAITSSTTTYVDDKIKAYKLPKSTVEIADFDEKKAIEPSNKKVEEKKEKYKNLSIDDLFKL